MRLIFFIFFLIALTAIAKESKVEIVRTITTEAKEVGLDPDLALAIATVESGLNPKAIGSLNEQGLYQLRPEYHKLTGTIQNNVKVGVRYLIEVKKISSGKYGSAWFVSYNYGPYSSLKNPTKTRYYKRVMNELTKIKIQKYLIAGQ